MNLPNKLTMGRIVVSVLMLIMLMIPWYSLGIDFPTFNVAGKIVINLKYIIAGALFIIAALTDFLDGYIARSKNMVTDFGKVMDAIADKVLVNGILIILAYDGFISVAIPVIIITRDIFVDSFKMASGKKGKVVAASYIGKAKTMCMMIGIALTLFYNLPFELVGLNIGYALIIIATVLSVVSACDYYFKTKDSFTAK
ncbi:MAG: CDP-diacylglycerol--glycerol-3-phosphate 3-phosphatidyltransferase [Ruminococcus sp.]|nr:CDP-diacylglycerol--glycerol-3-phosphate 3-phosphatidyltransferase [Ruminococcus sp.]